MAVKFAGWGNSQFVIPTTGAPASGYKLWTYVAGSSTPVTTYTTSAGTVAQSNPIILNSAGFPTTGQIWITEGTTVKIVFTDASDVVIKTEDNIPGVNDATLTQDEWISGPAPTFISTTSFTLVGDQTTVFHVGRRVRTTNSGGTIYSRISVTAFTTLTTVTVVNDSGVLDSGLSAVSYGLLSATDLAIPRLTAVNKRLIDLPGLADDNTFTNINTFTDTNLKIAGSSDATKLVRFEVDGLTTGTTRVITIPDSDISILGSSLKRKSADETVTSSTTLQNDDHLIFPVGANEEWVIDYWISAGAALATTGAQFGFDVPAAFSGFNAVVQITGSVGRTASITAFGFTPAAFGVFNEDLIHLSVWFLNGANAGNITLQWSQQTSSGSALLFRKGSYAIAHKI